MNALELIDALEDVSKYSDWEHWDTLDAVATELRRLHAENEALRVDAERYRYLRNRYPSDVLDKTGLEAGAWIDCEDINGTLVLLTGEHADETIDAERSKT